MKVADIRAWLVRSRANGDACVIGACRVDASLARSASSLPMPSLPMPSLRMPSLRMPSLRMPSLPAPTVVSIVLSMALSIRAASRARWPRVVAVVLATCALLPLARPQVGEAAPLASGIEWPTHHDGAVLRPLALSEVEHRFAQRFPGRIARFTDGASRVFVLRHVTEPTRMLHPAADCFRATGYAIEQSRLERDERQRLWRCFVARRGSDAGGGPAEALRVCERIEQAVATSADAATDAPDRAFTDTSAWFWAATLGNSRGPWLATTKVEAL